MAALVFLIIKQLEVYDTHTQWTSHAISISVLQFIFSTIINHLPKAMRIADYREIVLM